MRSLALDLRQYWENTDVTWREFLDLLDLQFQQVADWESGKHQARYSTIVKIHNRLQGLEIKKAPGFFTRLLSFR